MTSLASLLPALFLTVSLVFSPQSGTQTAIPMTKANGTFDVKSAATTHAPEPTLGSYSLDKIYHGDMDGTGKGEMLSAGDPASGNAGYVAIERFTGSLAGKQGTFAIMQFGAMTAGTAPQLTATIVPGSGTGALSGIYGSMTIAIDSGKHKYTLDYAFSGK